MKKVEVISFVSWILLHYTCSVHVVDIHCKKLDCHLIKSKLFKCPQNFSFTRKPQAFMLITSNRMYAGVTSSVQDLQQFNKKMVLI